MKKNKLSNETIRKDLYNRYPRCIDNHENPTSLKMETKKE